MPTLKLFVRDLADAEGAHRLEDAVRRLPGVYGAVACARARCVEVDFEDDDVGVAAIMEAAGRAGFPARLVG